MFFGTLGGWTFPSGNIDHTFHSFKLSVSNRIGRRWEQGIRPRRRVAIIGAGVSGLGAAWALSKHPDRFAIRVFEANDRIGGNAVTADMPQDDGSSIPFDVSVTACIPSVYHHFRLLLRRFDIDLLDTRFSYSVKYRDQIYAHDLESEIGRELESEIRRFQKLMAQLHRVGVLSRSRSKFLSAINPFNYVSMGTVLDLWGFSGAFKFKVLKPMFVNFLMATNVFDMPASLFARYLEFFNIESATPMLTWDQGTRRIYEALSVGFRDRITSVARFGKCLACLPRWWSRTRAAARSTSTMSSLPATRTRR